MKRVCVHPGARHADVVGQVGVARVVFGVVRAMGTMPVSACTSFRPIGRPYPDTVCRGAHAASAAQ